MRHTPVCYVVLVMLLCLVSQATAQTAPSAAAPPAGVSKEIRDSTAKVVAQLLAEAREIDQIENPKNKPIFERPHPMMQTMSLDAMPVLMPAFLGKLTDNQYRDAYVRWHMLYIINKAPDEEHQKVAQQLVKVLEDIPGRLQVKGMSEGEYDNPDLHAEYSKIVNGELRVITGYPPHQKYVYPPASIELMPQQHRARAQQLWVYAQKLKDKFKWIPNPEGIAFNRRVSQVNYIAREYMGEIVYALARSEDPRIIAAVLREIDKHARQGSLSAFDMLNYLYQASFDGYFKKYSRAELNDFAKQLETTARATEGLWVTQGHYKRNFAHYSFHMIESFKINDTMAVVSEGKRK